MHELTKNCEGTRRRDFLQVGLGACFGLGLADLARLQAATDGAGNRARSGPSATAQRCIVLFLDGGPSHYETFDPKPEAPEGVRGEFKPIGTNVPGLQICETLPKLAAIADKYAVLRSVAHNDPNHGGGNHFMMTGTPTPIPVNCGAHVSFHPSLGSVVSAQQGAVRPGVPAYVAMPKQTRSGGPNFLGARHAPFQIGGDPNSKGYRVRDVVLPKGISESRAGTRRELRAALDRMQRARDGQAADPTVNFDSYVDQAFDLITSQDAQRAFDISQESDAVRDLYGRHDVGQRLLLARRLLEVGVRFVTVLWGGWDHHTNIFKSYQSKVMPRLDEALSGLLTDLESRRMLDDTLVLCFGEFGRTPKVNSNAGRDHWPHSMSVFAAGGGVPGGQAIGATDSKGFYADRNVYSPQDLAASVYTKLGIDPRHHLHTNTGRPIQIVPGGRPISELFA